MLSKFWDNAIGLNHTISQRVFVFTMLVSILAGLAVTTIGALFTYGAVVSWPILLLLFVLSMGGVVIANVANSIPVKLFGYAVMTGAMGMFLGPFVALYTTASVFKIFGLTSVVVAVCGTIGVIYPKSLESYGMYLFGALVVLLVCYFGVIILSAMGIAVAGALTVLDVIGVIIFSALTIYDFNQAMHVERNVNNAINSGINIYLDFVNIFIRLLSLLGDKK